MKLNNKYLALACIFFLGLILRLVLLNSRPLGLTWDEAALGYNAYSLLQTGRDEYGQILPLVFKSFGDYKPGLYIYFSVLPVFFNLNIFTTRFASAVFGSLSVLVIYLLVRKLFPRAHHSAPLAALLLAINPWAIHFSRGAWEANLSLFLTLLAVTLFYYKKMALSVLFFALTFYTYQGAKLFTPLLLFGIFYINKISIKKAIYYLLPIALLILPLLINLPGQGGRLNVYNVFNYTRTPETVSNILRQDNLSRPTVFWHLFHAEIIDQGRGVVQRFLNHLSLRYLFVSGDWSNARHSIPYQGYLYYPEIITLILGVVYLIKNMRPSTTLIFYWIIIAVLPSALSRDIVSGVRSLPLIVPLTVISAVGLSLFSRYGKLILIWFSVLIFFIFYFFDLYFIHLPKLNGVAWLTAYSPAIYQVSQYENQYEQIYFSDRLGQPYIFVLFFNRIDPAAYQKSAYLMENSQGDVGRVVQFGKYHFGPLYWPTMRNYTGSLFVGDIYELPEQDLDQPNLINHGLITYPNGAPAFRIVGTL